MAGDRVPFSAVKVGELITFDNGYYMTGKITKSVGTHHGKRMVWFLRHDAESPMVLSYAAHRSVIRHGE